MRPSSLPAGLFRLVVASAVATVAIAPASHAASAPGTVIGPATFDAGATAITLPYSGQAPKPQLFRISGTHYYYEFQPARLTRPMVQFKRVGAPLERFTLANRPSGRAVRLSFVLTRPGAPSAVVDQAAHTIRILPFGTAVASTSVTPRPTPRPATASRPKPQAATARPGQRAGIGRPYLDATRGMVIVPFSGPTPDFRSGVLESDRRWIYFDFENATPVAGSRPYGRFNDPQFLRWAMARRPQRAATRLSVRLASRQTVSTEVHPELGQIWLMLPGRFPTSRLSNQPEPVPPALLPFPMPAGISTPTPVTAEGSPLPSPEPTPEATPTAAPTPEPEPSVALVRPQPVLTPPPATPKPTPRPKATAKPKPAIATRFGVAYYDHARQALVMPYTGAVPAYALQPTSPTALAVTFPKSTLTRKATLMQAFTYHPVLARWTAKETASEGLVRVDFTTVAPGEVLVAVDAARKQLLLLPQLAGSLELPAPENGEGTVFGRAYYDASTGAVVVPYQGPTPLYALAPVSANYMYLDFIHTGLTPAGIQFETLPANPSLNFWLMARRPEAPIVRMAFNLPFQGYPRVLDDKANSRLLLVPTRVQPSPAP